MEVLGLKRLKLRTRLKQLQAPSVQSSIRKLMVTANYHYLATQITALILGSYKNTVSEKKNRRWLQKVHLSTIEDVCLERLG